MDIKTLRSVQMYFAMLSLIMPLSFVNNSIKLTDLTADGMYTGDIVATEPELLNEYVILTIAGVEEFNGMAAQGYSAFGIEFYLEDESIPLEDRHWLNCRLRSAIAQMTHIVYTDEGTAINLDADWVYPGESYWQEVLIVNPPGDNKSENNFTDQVTIEGYSESGYLIDVYGNRVGNIALASKHAKLSRSGQSGAIQTGTRAWNNPVGDMYFTNLSSDGRVIPYYINSEYYSSRLSNNISHDGHISVWNKFNREISTLVLMDESGQVTKEVEIPWPLYATSISPNNQFVAFSGLSGTGSGIYRLPSDELILFEHGDAREPYISPNSKYIVLTSAYLDEYSIIFDTVTYEGYKVSNNLVVHPNPTRHVGRFSVSNDLDVLSVNGQVFLHGKEIISLPEYMESDVSPNGYFVLMYGDDVVGDQHIFDCISVAFINCNKG